MSVMRWDPFRDLLSIQDEMNRLFRRTLSEGDSGDAAEARPRWAPALDIAERDDAYVVHVEVPGVNPDDLEVTLEEGVLTVKGERRFTEESTKEHYHRVERRYGAFRRSITLPTQVMTDAIDATFKDGVLEITVPKAAEAKPRRIEVHPRPAVEAKAKTK